MIIRHENENHCLEHKKYINSNNYQKVSMGRGNKHKAEVERLLNIGYDPKDIIKITNIPTATVYRNIRALKDEAKIDFEALLTDDYLWRYYKTLHNYSDTIVICNEEIEAMKKRYDDMEKEIRHELENTPNTKNGARVNLLSNLTTLLGMRSTELTRLLSQRDNATSLKAKLLNVGPVVYSMNEFLKKNSNIPTTKVYEHPLLRKYKKEPIEENKFLPIEESVIEVKELPASYSISDDEREILKEMENEDDNT